MLSDPTPEVVQFAAHLMSEESLATRTPRQSRRSWLKMADSEVGYATLQISDRAMPLVSEFAT